MKHRIFDHSFVARLTAVIIAAAGVLGGSDACGAANPPTRIWAAQTSPREITLVWNRVTGAVRYRIYEGTGPDAKLLGQTTASGEQYVRPIATYGTTHQFSIDAIFENGEVSARAAFNPLVPQEVKAGIATPPASVKAAPSTAGTIALTWDAVPGATAYRIARQIVPGGFQVLCRLCPSDTSYVDDSAVPMARHVYTVATISAAGASRPAASNEVVATGDPGVVAAGPPAAAPGRTRTPPQPVESTPPKGTVQVAPGAGSCLSLGEQGNVLVRIADGSVRFFERVRYERGMKVVHDPGFRPVPGITNAVAVATSGRHSLVLLSDGTIRAWGRNDRGQLGAKTRQLYSDEPVPVNGITNAVAIAAGSAHSVALLADGTIRTWGSGDRGIAGDGREDVTTNRVAPGTAADVPNATAIAAGALTTFALLADGTIRGWGNNWGGLGFFGVLGTGEHRSHSATPLPVPGISNALAIATSGGSSLALLADGRVIAWGQAQARTRGQAEDWLSTSRPLPVPSVRTAAAVSPYLILLRDGTVRELRNPEERVTGINNAVAVASDPTNRYALLADGRLIGWGLKQFWPKGMVTVAELGAHTAQECGARAK